MQTPEQLIPRIFPELKSRYADRPGGYTRVLRIEPLKEDQAESAILELVDGPKDMRFAMTARAIARQREEGLKEHDLTAMNKKKVTQFRKDGVDALEAAVQQLQIRDSESEDVAALDGEESKSAREEAQRSAAQFASK